MLFFHTQLFTRLLKDRNGQSSFTMLNATLSSQDADLHSTVFAAHGAGGEQVPQNLLNCWNYCKTFCPSSALASHTYNSATRARTHTFLLTRPSASSSYTHIILITKYVYFFVACHMMIVLSLVCQSIPWYL